MKANGILIDRLYFSHIRGLTFLSITPPPGDGPASGFIKTKLRQGGGLNLSRENMSRLLDHLDSGGRLPLLYRMSEVIEFFTAPIFYIT